MIWSSILLLIFFFLVFLLLLYKDNGRFRKLISRVKNYEKEKGFVKTVFHSVKFLMHRIHKKLKYKTVAPVQGSQIFLPTDTINIAFRIGGGFGDFLIFANYLYYFKKKFSNKNLFTDVFFGSGIGNAKHLFPENGICRQAYNLYDFQNVENLYDLYIDLSRYPRFIHCDSEKIKTLTPELMEYISLIKKFEEENPRYFTGPTFDGQSAITSEFLGQKRIQQPDIYGYFGIKEEYEYPLFIKGSETAFLQKFGLERKRFITMHRGCDPQYPRHVKMWPLEFYAKLAKLIKNEFPYITIVEYGVSHDRCPHIDNVDMDIVGQTSMDEVKIILKNSLLHIDSDGGMVHLRHALHGGPCIAMYGPNYEPFFGYSENINVTGNGCTHFCDWLTEDWMINCARGYKEPPCMTSITPEMIMDLFRTFIKENWR